MEPYAVTSIIIRMIRDTRPYMEETEAEEEKEDEEDVNADGVTTSQQSGCMAGPTCAELGAEGTNAPPMLVPTGLDVG
jgi:hypothetical protein